MFGYPQSQTPTQVSPDNGLALRDTCLLYIRPGAVARREFLIYQQPEYIKPETFGESST